MAQINWNDPVYGFGKRSGGLLGGQASGGGGLFGGLFVNRAQAVKYALFENGRRPQAVVMVPGGLELDLAA